VKLRRSTVRPPYEPQVTCLLNRVRAVPVITEIGSQTAGPCITRQRSVSICALDPPCVRLQFRRHFRGQIWDNSFAKPCPSRPKERSHVAQCGPRNRRIFLSKSTISANCAVSTIHNRGVLGGRRRHSCERRLHQEGESLEAERRYTRLHDH
jgi:hypothetical protein